jgi:hypothetical protein
MAKGDDLYARIDVPFIKGFDMKSLPVGARWLYIWLWCHALECRREKIKRPPNDMLASSTGLSRHPIESYLNRLQVLKLISCDDCTIVMHGIKEKHKQFQWKDESNGDQTSPIQNQTPPQERNGERNPTEPNKKKIKKKKKFKFNQAKFDEFMETYPEPLKQGRTEKETTLKRWKMNLKDGVDPEEMILGARNRRESISTIDDRKYISGAQVFIGPKKQWLDWQELKSGRDSRGGNDYAKYN